MTETNAIEMVKELAAFEVMGGDAEQPDHALLGAAIIKLGMETASEVFEEAVEEIAELEVD